MDKNVLEQYEDACRLVDETKQDLKQLRKARHEIRYDSVQGSNPEFPYEPRSFHIAGLAYSVYDDPDAVQRAERLLTERLREAKRLKVQVEAWINKTPPRIQRIVWMKYIKRMTWEQVSVNMGLSSKGGARMVLHRYLEKNA